MGQFCEKARAEETVRTAAAADLGGAPAGGAAAADPSIPPPHPREQDTAGLLREILDRLEHMEEVLAAVHNFLASMGQQSAPLQAAPASSTWNGWQRTDWHDGQGTAGAGRPA